MWIALFSGERRRYVTALSPARPDRASTRRWLERCFVYGESGSAEGI